jgi:hypothetical protein
MRLACNILLKYSDTFLGEVLKGAIGHLGFEPNYYSVFFNQFKKPKNDLPFDENQILKLFNNSTRPNVVKIFSSIYDEDKVENNDKWFRISINNESEKQFQETIGNTFLLEWSNFNFDFLNESLFYKTLIESDNLIYCYFYNQTDASEQSDTHFNQFDEHPAEKKVIKDKLGGIKIDISENWGRFERIRSVTFIPAAKMYFGLAFNPIIDLDTLNKFKYSVKSNGKVKIDLYPIEENPKNHRDKQREFWHFIDKYHIKEKYENANKIDFKEWLLSKKGSK